ncbi:MAG TPA: RsmB/NOP family class I SAM-dependent RNA methyltransferase [Marinagarivorans sp.]
MTKRRTPSNRPTTNAYRNASPSRSSAKPPSRPTREQTPAQHYSPEVRIANQMRQALELWQQWLEQRNWYQLDRWLKHTLSKNRKFGKRDRLFYGDVLFNAARFGYWAAQVMALSQGATSTAQSVDDFAAATQNADALKNQLAILCQGASGDDFLALCQWRAQCDQALPEGIAKYASRIEALNNYRDTDLEGALVWHGIPSVYRPQLEALGKHHNLERFLQAQDSRPPLWLRLNHEDKRSAVMSELAEFYLAREDGSAISIEGQRGVFGLECYKNGWVEIQDWASQQLALKVAATPGQKVWDACAGGGGKTLAISAPLKNKGAVWATDIREHKLVEVKRRAKQANFYNIRTAPWDGETPFRLPKEIANDGGFDWVLVDGPCSSSGTWRRNPDAKLRNSGEDLTALTALQLKLLNQACVAVKPGGKLVYGTCSFFDCENGAIVEQFLAQNSHWQLDSSELMGCPYNNSDTLFAAVLSRTT